MKELQEIKRKPCYCILKQDIIYPDLENNVFRAQRMEGKLCQKYKFNYGGCLHKVGFKVNREVSLVGLEFLGPADDEDVADFRVRIQICREEEQWTFCNKILCCFGGEPYFKINDLLPLYTVDVVGCRRGRNFCVPLPQTIDIAPNVWTDIKFELVGPCTRRLKDGRGEDLDCVPTDESVVQFDFLDGSRQLAAVHFVNKAKETCIFMEESIINQPRKK